MNRYECDVLNCRDTFPLDRKSYVLWTLLPKPCKFSFDAVTFKRWFQCSLSHCSRPHTCAFQWTTHYLCTFPTVRLPGCRDSNLRAVVNMHDSSKMHCRRSGVSLRTPGQQSKGKVLLRNAESLETVRYVIHKRVTPLVSFNALKHAPSSSSMLQFLHCDFNVRTWRRWRYVGLQNALPIPLFRMRRSTFLVAKAGYAKVRHTQLLWRHLLRMVSWMQQKSTLAAPARRHWKADKARV